MDDPRRDALAEARQYYLDGAFDAAIELVEMLLDAHGDWGEGLLLRGKVLFELGRKIEAAHTLTRAVSVDPDNAEAFFALGLTFRHIRKFEDAEGCLKASLRRNPADHEARFILANTLYDQQKLDEAILTYQAVVEASPGFTDAWFNLGRAAGEAGQSELATASLTQFLSRTSPGDDDQLRSKADAMLARLAAGLPLETEPD